MGNVANTTIQYNDSDVKRALAGKPKFAEGIYRLRITSVTKKVNDRGNMSLVLGVHAIDEDGQARGPNKLQYWVTLPMRTPPHVLEEQGLGEDFKQKKIPNTLGMCQQILRAIFGGSSYPTFPKYVDGTDGLFETVDGDTITAEEKAALVEGTLTPNILSKMTELWNEHESLVGEEFIARLGYRKANNGRTYFSVKAPLAELPRDPDTGVVTETFVDMNDPYQSIDEDGEVA